MKLFPVLTATALVALLSYSATTAFAENATNTPPPARHGPRGAGSMLDHILPPKIVESLALTADQKTTLDSLNEAFKKDAAKWHADNPIDQAAAKQARETGDREAKRQFREKQQGLNDLRKGYVDKLRATLTDEQKTRLATALDEMHSRKSDGKNGPKPVKNTPPPAE